MEENMWLTVCHLCSGLPGDKAADFSWTVILKILNHYFSIQSFFVYYRRVFWCFNHLPKFPVNLLMSHFCVCFPRVLTSTLMESLEYFKPFGGYYFFNTLLFVLQALHVFWAYLILRMVYKFVFMGKVRSGLMKSINTSIVLVFEGWTLT